MSYSQAVEIAASPTSFEQATTLFSSIGTVIAFVIFIPLILYLSATLVWDLNQSHKYNKLWHMDNFWLSIIVLVVVDLLLLIFSPYLFILLV